MVKPSRAAIAAAARKKLAAAREGLPPGRVTLRMLGFAAEAAFAVPIEDILGPRRMKPLQPPRRAIVLFGRERLRRSYPEIGRYLNRDNKTAIHARKQCERNLAEDPDFAARCAAVEALLWPPPS